MFSNYLANLLLYSKEDFVNFLRQRGLKDLEFTAGEVLEILLKKCGEDDIHGRGDNFESWLLKEVERYLDEMQDI